MTDTIWILGVHMTKFGKHPNRDLVDLAAESALGALGDADVTIQDVDVIAAGNVTGGPAGIGQPLQKQIGQTGVPVYNVTNACATGATALRTAIMAIKAGEAEIGLAVGVEKLSGAGLLGVTGAARSEGDPWVPEGRFGAVAPMDGWVGTSTHTPECHSSCSPGSARRTTRIRPSIRAPRTRSGCRSTRS
jgi:acetyl-CoA acetyltransferase